MKKTTKGAIAAGGAAVLLMGGAGTLAFWTAHGTVNGTSIAAGHLRLDTSDCNSTGWKIDGSPSPVAFDPATGNLVPGDTITKTCDVKVNVKGTHFSHLNIQAVTQNSFAAPWDELTIATTVEGSATGANNVTVVQGDNTVPVSITVTWPYGAAADNDLNGSVTDLSTVLSNIDVTAVQLHN